MKKPVPRKVFDFLVKNRGQAFCDDCIAEACDLPRRQEANIVCASLGLCREFRREKGCVTPGHEHKLGTRAV